MSKYDNLDPRKQLEQTISDDLKRALEKRGFVVRHNGTPSQHAPANVPDIEIWDDNYHINVEATKREKSSAEGEFISIKTHMENVKRDNPRKKCFVLYVSPETHYRMMNTIRDYDLSKKDEPDMKIMPLSFATFELIINKFIISPRDVYPKNQILNLFEKYRDFINDERILKVVSELLFSDDSRLLADIQIQEDNSHQKTIQDLIKDLKKLEDDLRKNGIATHDEAIKNVIYLVFMKLYEEKREYEGKINRFNRVGFSKYQEIEEDTRTAVHKLFKKIKGDSELKSTKTLTAFDRLAEKMNDKFVIEYFIIPFEKYYFYTTKVDGLGAAYEVLGELSGKDVKAGQFFTPENIVKVMVKLTEFSPEDVVLDPACGTARFLIYAMYDMLDKVRGANAENKKEKIKKEKLYGTDFDAYVAKLAKMNMYIHKDGKTNVNDKDGLLLYEYDEKIDVVITNPPLGNLNYWVQGYDDAFRKERMELIPKRNGEVTGNELKGGALFLNASKYYLKSVRDEDAKPEWKGGKLVIILDESIFNVDDYKPFRDFIKKNFYIKAIISLTPDTFVPVSKTANKTSILFAIKKEDKDAVQTEPVFFAYIDKVGLNTKKKVCDNHLFNEQNEDLITAYFGFKYQILGSYHAQHFNVQDFKSKVRVGRPHKISDNSYWFARTSNEIIAEDRIDLRFHDPKYDEIKKYMRSKDVLPFGQLITDSGQYGLNESGLERGKIPFVNIENLTEEGLINSENIRFVKEAPEDRILKEGDLLISRSRLVGLASIATKREEGYTYGSYMIRFKPKAGTNSFFIAKFFNSVRGRLQTELLKTGATGENINTNQLSSVAIPNIARPEQDRIIEKIRLAEKESAELHKKAEDKKQEAKLIIDEYEVMK